METLFENDSQKNQAIVTPKKEAKEKSAKIPYKALFNSYYTAIFFVTQHQNDISIVNCNSTAERIFKQTKEQLLFTKFPFSTEIVLDAYKRKEPIEFKYPVQNRELTCETYIQKITCKRQKYFVFYVRDITVERQLQEGLRQADKLSSLGKVSSYVVHEIRSPLSVISTNLYFLQSYFKNKEIERDVSAAIENSIKGVHRITTVAENTLSLVRPGKPSKQYNDINTVIQQSLFWCKKKQNITIIKNYAQSLPLILIDPIQISQVIINLFNNAVEALPNGGTIEISTRKERKRKKNYVVVEIKDDGQGISTNDIPNIFNQFFTTKNEGTGVGLTLTKEIVESHNATISVESKLNVGTIFTILFSI